jgi:hypothetical protein
LDPQDLLTIGYPEPGIWEAIDQARGQPGPAKQPKLTRYRLQRRLIIRLRGLTQRHAFMHKGITWLRMVCDVLLREY